MTEQSIQTIRRTVIHFPGYEPLDAEAHRQRYERAAKQSAATFGFSVETGALDLSSPMAKFEVLAQGPNWQTRSTIHILGHDEIINGLAAAPLPVRLLRGYRAGVATLFEGGLYRYFKVSWRFGLFFLFPLVFMAIGIAAFVLVASAPVWFNLGIGHLFWSVPLAAATYVFVFLPFAARLHTLHLFDDWHLAVRLARLDDTDLKALIESHALAIEESLHETADQYLVTSHSLGSTLATHALGAALERNLPSLQGKAINFVTLGGSGLQSSLMRSANVLRSRIRSILLADNVNWADVQCLTDPVNFYRSRPARDNGHAELAEPAIITIRVKHMLTGERYKRIKSDILRIHRQFVLGSDQRSHFDFTLLTCGPFAAQDFRMFSASNPLPLSEGGALETQ